MARTVAERAARTSTPQTVEADLSALWRDVGRRGPIARAMMSNLVIFRGASASDADRPRRRRPRDMPIDAVSARHPSRVIFLDHETTAADAAGPISAEVGIVAFGPPQGRYGVERINVRSSCPTEWLPSLVRRVIRGDLPTSVWWADDLSHHAPEPPIVTMGRQLVYDSRQWTDIRGGVLALAPHISARESAAQPRRRTITESTHVDLADVNWRRLAPVRSALVIAAEGTQAATLTPADVRITHAPGEAALAWLLAGWMSSRLDWSSLPRIDETRRGDELLSVAIGEETHEVRAVLDDRRVTIARGGERRSVIAVRQEGEADAVAAELHALSHDACLHDALSALLRSFRAA